MGHILIGSALAALVGVAGVLGHERSSPAHRRDHERPHETHPVWSEERKAEKRAIEAAVTARAEQPISPPPPEVIVSDGAASARSHFLPDDELTHDWPSKGEVDHRQVEPQLTSKSDHTVETQLSSFSNLGAARVSARELSTVVESLGHVRKANGFRDMELKVVERAVDLANDGSPDCMRFGKHIYLQVDGRLHVIDEATHSVLDVSDREANAMINRTLREQARYEDANLHAFTAYAVGGDLRFLINDTEVTISSEPPRAQLAVLAAALKANSKAGADLIFTAQPDLTGKDRATIDRILNAASAMLDHERILVDDFDEMTLRRAATIRELPRLGSMVALVDDGSFGMSDDGAIRRVASRLQDAGVRIVHVSKKTTMDPLGEAGAFLITAHATRELGLLVDHLIKEGALSGKPVFFISCGTSVTRELTTRMIHEGNAHGVFQFKDALNLQKVSGLFDGVLEGMKDTTSTTGFSELFEAVTREAETWGLWHVSLDLHALRSSERVS